MPKDPSIEIAKSIGWNLLGEALGIHVTQLPDVIIQFLAQELEHAAKENQALTQRVQELEATLKEKENRLRFQDLYIAMLKGLRQVHDVLDALHSSRLSPPPYGLKRAASTSSESRLIAVLPEHMRALILGAPGSGKSATAHLLLELLRWRQTPYILGFPADKASLLPDWIGTADSFDKIPPGSLILVDEAYLVHHSRKCSFDKQAQELSQALGLSRQRKHSLIFVTHEARLLDKNVTSYANFFVFKESGALGTEFERPELKKVLKKASEFFAEVAREERKSWSYVWSPEVQFEGPLQTPLPSYWSEDLSHAYAGGYLPAPQRDPHVSKEELKLTAKRLREAGLSYGEIGKRLNRSKSTIINWVKHGR